VENEEKGGKKRTCIENKQTGRQSQTQTKRKERKREATSNDSIDTGSERASIIREGNEVDRGTTKMKQSHSKGKQEREKQKEEAGKGGGTGGRQKLPKNIYFRCKKKKQR
jgi:hypothetical protein